jgi:deoxyribonuclease V
LVDLKLTFTHAWDLSPEEAIRLQGELRSRVLIQPLEIENVHTVAGVDVGFRDEQAHAAVVVLSYPSLQLLEDVVAEIPIPFPYVPGLLSFRETPAILAALEELPFLPDVLVCDGQGIAHPRRFGIACHLGVLLDKPAFGCAKSILVGRHGPLGEIPGSTSDLITGAEVVGAAVRTKQGVKPVYISVGHRVDLPAAVSFTLACTRGYRLPEPTRLADRLASRKGPLPPKEPPNYLKPL